MNISEIINGVKQKYEKNFQIKKQAAKEKGETPMIAGVLIFMNLFPSLFS